MISKHAIFLIGLGFSSGLISGAEETKIDFNRDIRPLLSNRCYACHGPDEETQEADLRLDTREGAIRDLGGYQAIKPGDPEDSEVVFRITLPQDDIDAMPPKGKGAQFTEDEVALIKRWIKQDAPYAKHWSYEPPKKPELPDFVSGELAGWPKNEIDRFVLARMESEGMKPSPEADRFSIARRVAMDLTGLPPTWEEAKAFVDDRGEGAYEKFVDAQLAKPAFGERWARVWLDLARYADSAGYADDPVRTIWAYRDYVIRSLNENKPFDQFTLEQIAGDLLENPTEEQLIATAFHRNTMTNSEGGTNDEEFRNAAIVDRVNTTMAVWMGTTIDCAQCHTHKYDPLTHHEYFQMFAFFNQTEDTDKKDERPTLEIWTKEQEQQKKAWEGELSHLKKTLGTQTPELEMEMQEWLTRVRKTPDWKPLKPISARGKTTVLEVAEDGGISADPEKLPKTDTYSVTLEVPDKPVKISALRLEISPEQKKNFVVSRLNAKWVPEGNSHPKARYIRVDLPGKKKMIHLAEVQVFSGGRNVAPGGTAKQSSQYVDGEAKRAIDGNTDGEYGKGSVQHTGANDENPWLEIDLGSEMPIEKVALWNRTDGNLQERLKGYRVSILNQSREKVWEQAPAEVPKPSSSFHPGGARDLEFQVATATHEQKGFPASAVLAEKTGKKTGWAIAGGTGKAQELTLIRKSPLELEGGKIQITIPQVSEYEAHLLTNFSFSWTADPDVSDWAGMPGGIRSLVEKSGELERTDLQKIAGYFRTVAPSLDDERAQLTRLENQLKTVKPSTTVPIMQEIVEADKRRKTNVHIRGNYASHGDEVEAAVPAVFHRLPEGETRDRLALAKWLVDEKNPLTARVVANRHWEQIFGIGLVETSEEFGSQGELPSHPELLDWLAIDLMESGWDLKRFLKQLVMSATYRQSSKTNPELGEADPYNRFLARGPRVRITAEMVRDQALFVSGLLSDKMFGPPVKPPQPEMGLKAAFGSATDWQTSAGDDKYRRGIYTTWRRSNPYPSMATFDAPNREICTVRRSRTNTPLQALVTLNDPVHVEAAQSLARRIVSEGGVDIADKAKFAIQTALVRKARDEEIEKISQFYKTAIGDYENDRDAAKQMAGESLPEGSDVVEHAAWTVVSNVILNLDEIFMKR